MLGIIGPAGIAGGTIGAPTMLAGDCCITGGIGGRAGIAAWINSDEDAKMPLGRLIPAI
tara:strand:- start:193 stop:369 length:177 start_codon:yes stop_codon:yes gene_type:complete